MSARELPRNFSTSRDLDAQRASLCATVRHVNRAEFALGHRLNLRGNSMGTERPTPSESRARPCLGGVLDLCPAIFRESALFQNQGYSAICSRLTA
jgi:hypothetical protein